MADSTPIGGHLIGPFSTPLRYEAPDIGGFLGVPRSGLQDPGWGEPYKDAAGLPITPGTPGGPNAASALFRRKGSWQTRRNASVQKVGEVSWRGARKSTKADAPRHILSVHGPSSRHFPTSFSYGSDDRHRNVYKEGGILAICPGPCLGACLQTISGKVYLTAVCLSDEGEVVLRRAAGAPYYGKSEKKMAALAAFRTADTPGGWVKIGTVDTSDYERPRTPWFFNESGTEGQCIRLKMKQGTFNGADREELACDRFKLTLTDGSATLVSLGNLPPYEFSESGSITQKGEWASPPYEGYPHYWDETNLHVQASCTGAQVVAIDYDGDQEIVCRAVISVQLDLNQDYMKGVDSLHYTGGGEPGYRNNGIYRNPLGIGVDPNATVGNHNADMWTQGGGQNYLSWTVRGVEYRQIFEVFGTQRETEYRGLPDNLVYLIFYRYYETWYIRHLDMRAGGLIVARLDQFENFPGQRNATTAISEVLDTDTTDDAAMSYLNTDKQYESFDPTFHERLGQHPSSSPARTWEIVNFETVGDRGTFWLPSYSWTASTHTGARPKDNDDEAIGQLPCNCWFPRESEMYRSGWYGLKALFHDKNQETASFCLREDKTFILSGQLPDPTTGEPAVFLETEPSELGALVGAGMYYPIGEM